jgi:hypothetical protein
VEVAILPRLLPLTAVHRRAAAVEVPHRLLREAAAVLRQAVRAAVQGRGAAAAVRRGDS